MINTSKSIVIDLDGTLCNLKQGDESYENLSPDLDIVEKLREYKALGFYIIIYTARNMRTHKGNIGLINATTAKIVTSWLDKNSIPYDEIHFGKPWQGHGGFYVDDKTIRPSEFLKLDYNEILKIVNGQS